MHRLWGRWCRHAVQSGAMRGAHSACQNQLHRRTDRPTDQLTMIYRLTQRYIAFDQHSEYSILESIVMGRGSPCGPYTSIGLLKALEFGAISCTENRCVRINSTAVTKYTTNRLVHPASSTHHRRHGLLRGAARTVILPNHLLGSHRFGCIGEMCALLSANC